MERETQFLDSVFPSVQEEEKEGEENCFVELILYLVL